jgi:hypothetical protein
MAGNKIGKTLCGAMERHAPYGSLSGLVARAEIQQTVDRALPGATPRTTR